MRFSGTAMLCGVVSLCFALPAYTNARADGGNDDKEARLPCPANAVHSTGSLPVFPNVSVIGDFVYLNARVEPTGVVFWAPPANKALVLTDFVVQNRAPGDEPVMSTQFSRTAITAPNGTDAFFSVVGNDTLNQHFHTGIVEPSLFRFYNLANSSAPFVEVTITGRLRECARS